MRDGGRPMLERRHKTAASTALALLSISTRTREAWEAPPSARLRKRTTHVLRARVRALKRSVESGSKHSRRLASRTPAGAHHMTPPPHVKAATGGGPRMLTSHHKPGSSRQRSRLPRGVLGKRKPAESDRSNGSSSDGGSAADEEPGDGSWPDGIWFPGCTHVVVVKKLREAAKRARTAAGIDLALRSTSKAPPGLLHVDNPKVRLPPRRTARRSRASHRKSTKQAAGQQQPPGPSPEADQEVPYHKADFQHRLKDFFDNLRPRRDEGPHGKAALGGKRPAGMGQASFEKPPEGQWQAGQWRALPFPSPTSSGPDHALGMGHTSDAEARPAHASSPEEALAWARANYKGPLIESRSRHSADAQAALPADAFPAASAGDAPNAEVPTPSGSSGMRSDDGSLQQLESSGVPGALPEAASEQGLQAGSLLSRLCRPLVMSTEFDPVPYTAPPQLLKPADQPSRVHGAWMRQPEQHGQQSDKHPELIPEASQQEHGVPASAAAASHSMPHLPKHSEKEFAADDNDAAASRMPCPEDPKPRAHQAPQKAWDRYVAQLCHVDSIPSHLTSQANKGQASETSEGPELVTSANTTPPQQAEHDQDGALQGSQHQQGSGAVEEEEGDDDVVIDIFGGSAAQPVANTRAGPAQSDSGSDVEIIAVVDADLQPPPGPAQAAGQAVRQAASVRLSAPSTAGPHQQDEPGGHGARRIGDHGSGSATDLPDGNGRHVRQGSLLKTSGGNAEPQTLASPKHPRH